MEVLYENLEDIFGIFNSDFQFLFDSIRDNGVYNLMGFSFLAITFFVFAGFYFLYKNPYAKFFPDWVLALVISGVLSAIVTFSIARGGLAEYLLDNDPEVVDFANKMVWFYTMMNLGLTVIFGFLISFVLRLKSKVQPHLPF
ncbi:MAG: hypothetical protein HWE07_14650 [Cytophagia bacterium]|nr:hypothetical protein [Cytophagia bacterium]